MTRDEAFLMVHAQMARQGPGHADDVLWALERLGTPDEARIVDAGCGPGADCVTLAQARPQAQIEGIEALEHLADEARERCRALANVTIRQRDMTRILGTADLIWCAGALYFLGVTEGLRGWREALTPQGAVAFSEPVLPEGAGEGARKFWADYPAITDLDGIAARVQAAGFTVLDHRLVQDAAWADYYVGLEERIAELRPGAEAVLAEVLDAEQGEIDTWRAAPDEIAYALVLAVPG